MQGLTLTATIAEEKCHVFNVDLCQIQWKSRLRSPGHTIHAQRVCGGQLLCKV